MIQRAKGLPSCKETEQVGRSMTGRGRIVSHRSSPELIGGAAETSDFPSHTSQDMEGELLVEGMVPTGSKRLGTRFLGHVQGSRVGSGPGHTSRGKKIENILP